MNPTAHERRMAKNLRRLLAILIVSAVPSAAAEEAQKFPELPPVAGIEHDVQLRSGLNHCRAKFLRQKTGLVVFTGGSVTSAPGWTQLVSADLQRRFPETQFTFVNAGVPSIDSTGHAFRFQRDVLEKGLPDLLFVEAAVNDLHNGRTAVERRRGFEGVVRRARKANRFVDIVCLHFAEPQFTADYNVGRVPEVIASHDEVAAHYQLPSVNLAQEVQRRLQAGQFDWKQDFRDLHPSRFGHELYFRSIRRLLDQAWSTSAAAPDAPALPEHPLPAPLDRFSYDAALPVSSAMAVSTQGFSTVPAWKPTDGAATRDGFVNVPMLVGEHPGDSFRFSFEGRGVGLFLVAGPDSGMIEYRIDQGDWKSRDPFTRWSSGLHLPWVLVLESELPQSLHELEVRIAGDRNDASVGTAIRIRDLLVNGPDYNVPALEELTVRSTLDGTDQPSLLWVPPQLKDRSAQSVPAPMLVYLHSWSSDYRQDNSPWQHQAVRRGWIYLHPNFRGVNRQPQACGSQFARQDLIDAVDEVVARFPVDTERIYLAGTSGGGHMSLLMAGYHPDRFSAVSAWASITDLAEWYRFHVKDGRPDHYARMMIDSLGGPPGQSPMTDAEFRNRSPLFQLQRAVGVPIDISTGVRDGHTGSVPIMHSLYAFNVLAAAAGHPVIPETEIQELWTRGELTDPRPTDLETDETFRRRLFLRRQAGAARVSIFDGGHEGLPEAACEWLSQQQRATASVKSPSRAPQNSD